MPDAQGTTLSTSPTRRAGKAKRRARPKTIDKSVLSFPEPRRVRDRNHVKAVAQHPCLICGRRPADAHHLRFAQSRALGRKVSDEFTVPLCRGHHREVHRCGDEAGWWKNAGVDPSHRGPRAVAGDASASDSFRQNGPRRRGFCCRCRHRSEITPSDDRPIGKRGPNYKTKPIIAADPSSALSKRTRGI